LGFKHFFGIFLVSFFLFGFQVIPRGNQWLIDASTAQSSKLFVVYPKATQSLPNDLPSDDPLAGTTTVTIAQLMTSVLNDFNQVQGAFVTLVDSNDPDFATLSADRTITLEDGSTSGAFSGGEAQLNWNGVNIVGCRIVFKPVIFDGARSFVAAATHEIGHCLGLNHPMETVHSVMSYFSDSSIARLQIDDKMGLVHLYPSDRTKAKEDATLGLSCEPR